MILTIFLGILFLLLLILFPTIIMLSVGYIIDFVNTYKELKSVSNKKYSIKDIHKEITGPYATGCIDFFKFDGGLLILPGINYGTLIVIIIYYTFKFIYYLYTIFKINSIIKYIWNIIVKITYFIFFPVIKLYKYIYDVLNNLLDKKFI